MRCSGPEPSRALRRVLAAAAQHEATGQHRTDACQLGVDADDRDPRSAFEVAHGDDRCDRSRSALVTWSLAAALGATQVTTSVAPLLPSGSGGMTHCHAPLMPMVLPA